MVSSQLVNVSEWSIAQRIDQLKLILRLLKFLNMKIIPLSEGSFTVDQSKKFIPFQLDKDDLQERTKGSLLVEIQPFAVITSKDILLLDTGLGLCR